MSSKRINISGDTWFHREKPVMEILYLTLATGIAALLTVVLFRPEVNLIVGTLSLVMLVALSIYITKSAPSSIEIDRDQGEVRTARNFHVITYRRRYPLRAFDSVVLATSDEPVEGGYRFTRYSALLSGKERSLEVFTADTESEGRTIQTELSEFLGLPAQGEIGSRDK